MRARHPLHVLQASLALLLLDAAAAADTPPARLGDTGLFADAELTTVAAGNLPFSPQYPLWTDGAAKQRWIRLPAGTAIDASRPDDWQFPVGTRFWKEFSFGGRRVETRFMQRLTDGTWQYATYVFSADGKDALLAPAGGTHASAQIGPGLRHAIPGQSDCRVCHEGRATPVLGFGMLQLSSDRDPNAPHAEPLPDGAVDLRALAARGLVRGLPASVVARPPRIPARTPIERAALGYLHANCGHCHNDAGPLAALGLSLDQQPASAAAVSAALATTVAQTSQFRTADGATLRIAPGQPDLAVLALRMRSRQPIAQMPPLGTQLVDEDGLAVIARWISTDLTTRVPNNKKENRP